MAQQTGESIFTMLVQFNTLKVLLKGDLWLTLTHVMRENLTVHNSIHA